MSAASQEPHDLSCSLVLFLGQEGTPNGHNVTIKRHQLTLMNDDGRQHPDSGAAELVPDFGVMVGGASGGLFQTLVLFVAAVVLLDEDRSSPTLLKTLLLVVRPEL